MNSRSLSLVLTLLAAGQLVALVSLSRSGRAPGAGEPTPDRPATETEGAGASPAALPVAAEPQPAPRSAQAFHWATLESTNYATYIANLRAFGVPEPTVRDIIIAELNKLYEPREAALKAALGHAATNRPDLGTTRLNVGARLENLRKLRELQQEKNALIKTLLGPGAALELAWPEVPGKSGLLAACSRLPPDKRDQVLEIELDHLEHMEALRKDWMASAGQREPGRRGPDLLTPVRQAQAQRLAQLSQVLTPNELEDYEMRTSRLAAELAESLALFQPSEEEYRQIFRIRRQAEGADRWTATGLPARASPEEVEAQLKAALGEQRYADYQRAQDPTYEQLRHLAQRYNLPPDNTDQVYDQLKPLLQKAEQIELDDTLDEAQQNQALRQLRDQVNRLLVDRLGERAARAFRGSSDLFREDSPEP